MYRNRRHIRIICLTVFILACTVTFAADDDSTKKDKKPLPVTTRIRDKEQGMATRKFVKLDKYINDQFTAKQPAF